MRATSFQGTLGGLAGSWLVAPIRVRQIRRSQMMTPETEGLVRKSHEQVTTIDLKTNEGSVWLATRRE